MLNIEESWDDMKFIKNPEIVVQRNDVGVVLLHMDSGEFYSLYDVSACIWGYIEQGLSQKKIVKKIASEYDVLEKKAFADVELFLKKLHKEHLILVR